MTTDSPGSAVRLSTRARPGVVGRIWREALRPFRRHTWGKWVPARHHASRPSQAITQQVASEPCAAIVKAAIPSMISAEEAAYFTTCSRGCGGSAGEIVDLGCWMGATAIALAEGIVQRGTPAVRGDRVMAFDLFQWAPWMTECSRTPTFGIYAQGESFLPEARRIVQDHGHGLVDLVQADLETYCWLGQPIKLLLVDAMKGPALMRQIARTFFASVIPGGLVLHQDFKHFFTSWIHVLHYRLRHHFRMLESVRQSGTVGFEITRPLAPDEVVVACDYEGISNEESDRCFNYSLRLLDQSEHASVAAAHVVHYCHMNRLDKAQRLAAHYARQGFDQQGEFPLAIRLLEEKSRLWTAA